MYSDKYSLQQLTNGQISRNVSRNLKTNIKIFSEQNVLYIVTQSDYKHKPMRILNKQKMFMCNKYEYSKRTVSCHKYEMKIKFRNCCSTIITLFFQTIIFCSHKHDQELF